MSSVLTTALTLGVVYGLVGAAVATVATATRTLHLAVGPILVAGVLTALTLDAGGVAPPLAVGAGLAVGALVSAALEPLVLRPLRGTLPRLVGLAVAGAVVEVVTARTLGTRTLRPDPLIPGADPVLLAVVVGLPLVALLSVVAARSRWGRRLRVVGGDPAAAERAGIDPSRTRAGVLAVAGAVTVAAGLLVAPIAFVGVGGGLAYTVRGVAAGALLGRRPPAWALAGGMLLGTVEAVALRVLPAAGPDVAIAVVVVGALALRGTDDRRGWGRVW